MSFLQFVFYDSFDWLVIEPVFIHFQEKTGERGTRKRLSEAKLRAYAMSRSRDQRRGAGEEGAMTVPTNTLVHVSAHTALSFPRPFIGLVIV